MKNFYSLWLISMIGFWPLTMNHLWHHPPNEICDNALDDDGDGLIDLNDPECDCPEVTPTSLIPNPSFEIQECCPTDRAQMECAETWIQASTATTDYLHTCGWLGWDDLPVPLPLPDGEGCVGYRNGRDLRPHWKEYTGACLTNTMKAGDSYRFQFHIGFTNPMNSPPTNVVFYGAPLWENLPFGENNGDFGCPTNDPHWIELGRVHTSGANQWLLEEINIVPPRDITAIAIGPDCDATNSPVNLYYFFDNLVLAAQEAFELEIRPVHHPCEDNFYLKVPLKDSLTYQWYKEGVALLGETQVELQSPMSEGNYQVRMIGPNSCGLTNVYHYQIPSAFTVEEVLICDGETYNFNQQNLLQSGVYLDTLKNSFHCDSIIELHLTVIGEKVDTVSAKIFETEPFILGSRQFSEAGAYDLVLNSSENCDSLVHLILDFYHIYIPTAFTPDLDGFNDVFTVFGGDDLQTIRILQVFDRWGGLVFEAQDIAPNDLKTGWDGLVEEKAAPSGVYVYQAKLVFDDNQERVFAGSVTLVR